MNVNYGDILQRSFQIAKNNRFLWIFGILIAIFNFSGNAPNINSNFGDTGKIAFPKIDPDTLLLIIIVGAIALIVLGLLGAFISSLARAGLIHMVNKIDSGAQTSIKEGFSTGFSLALPLILIGLLLFVPFALVAIIIGAITVGPGILLLVSKAEVAGIILIIIGALIWIALLIVGAVTLVIVSQYATRYYVLTENGIIDSIKSGFALLRQRIGPSLLLWLINVIISFAEGIIVLMLLLILGLPIGLLAFAISLWLLVFLIIPFIAIIFVSGLFETYYSTYWTLAFKELIQNN